MNTKMYGQPTRQFQGKDTSEWIDSNVVVMVVVIAVDNNNCTLAISIPLHRQVMESLFGYSVHVAPSDVPGLGSGVVLKGRKDAIRGQLVALYPGGLYLPQQPVLLPSLANPFILRCADGVLVDGCRRGLSGAIFR